MAGRERDAHAGERRCGVEVRECGARVSAVAVHEQPIFPLFFGSTTKATPPVLKPAAGFETGGESKPSPPGVELALMAPFITVDLNPMPPKISGNGYFEPVVLGGGRWSSVVTSCFHYFLELCRQRGIGYVCITDDVMLY